MSMSLWLVLTVFHPFLGLPHFDVAMSQNLVTPNATHSDSWLLDVDFDPCPSGRIA
jgi:hypothetical protein